MQECSFFSHIRRDERGEIVWKKPLSVHLEETAKLSEQKVDEFPSCVPVGVDMAKLAYLNGLTHDFGKFTGYFQDYLLHGKVSEEKNHGFISALFAAYQAEGFVSLSSEKVSEYYPLICYIAVLHHHGNLGSLDDDLIRKKFLSDPNFMSVEPNFRLKLQVMKKQVSDLESNLTALKEIYANLLPEHNFQIGDFLHGWMDTLSKLDVLQYRLQNYESETDKLKIYSALLLLYSVLIDSDKKSAADLKRDAVRWEIPADIVDRYRNEIFDINVRTGINGIRNEIYEKTVSAIENVELDRKIFTLTAPTGTGKTLSALSAALKLQAKVKREKGYFPRLIYSLPFTSIIDQNFSVIEEVLGLLNEYKPNKTSFLLKHHYLANVEFKEEDFDRESDEALLLIESWESEIIVTTFVQLLQTLIGYKNKFLKKYHRIAGSIILLDEVQNIPVKYWPLVGNMLKLLTDSLGCYVILLTATRPLIFNPEECYELLEDNQKYFHAFNRTRLKTNTEGISLDEFIDECLRIYHPEKSLLVVLNTIKSSIQVYNRMDEEVGAKNPVFYLSTNIVPAQREKRLLEINESLDAGEKPVVVSTQVVEAGVDLDFDCVIRDIGPVDSVVQVAGRCNRSAARDEADVFIFNVKNEKGRSFASFVYGPISIAAAETSLPTGDYPEKEFMGLVNSFFNEVSRKKSSEISDELWKAATALRFDSSLLPALSHFSLIEAKGGYVDVFVEIDPKAVAVWEQYDETVRKESDFRESIPNFLRIKRQFLSYIISVPVKFAVNLIREREYFFRLPYEWIDRFYDYKTGFKRIEEDSEEEAWIL